MKVLVRKSALALAALGFFFVLVGGLFRVLPGGFLPDEDQGVFFIAVRLPDGASLERNRRATEEVEKIVMSTPGVADCTTFGGLDITSQTTNSNTTTVIATLKPWEERRAKNLQLTSILAQSQRRFGQIQDAFVFGFGLPPILGLSPAGGFEFMVEDRAGGDINQLAEVAQSLLDAARSRAEIVNANTVEASCLTDALPGIFDVHEMRALAPTG